MDARKRKKVTSWIFVYAALIAAVVFASQSGATAPRELSALSPVILGGDAPALRVESVVRRSDI